MMIFSGSKIYLRTYFSLSSVLSSFFNIHTKNSTSFAYVGFFRVRMKRLDNVNEWKRMRRVVRESKIGGMWGLIRDKIR